MIYIYIYIYLVLKKYSSIRLQVSCCCNHQVFIIYDLKITKKNNKKKYMYIYQKKYTTFHQYKNTLSCVCQKRFKLYFIFLCNNLF